MADQGDNKEDKPNINDDSRLRMSKNVTLAVKLNGSTYPLWQKLKRIASGGRRALWHLTGIPAPTEPGAKGYKRMGTRRLFIQVSHQIERTIRCD